MPIQVYIQCIVAIQVYTQSDVIHCLLWPLIVIAVCAAVFLYVELSSRGLVRPLPCATATHKPPTHDDTAPHRLNNAAAAEPAHHHPQSSSSDSPH